MKVLLTGGGTGGHLFPALAVAEGLRKAQPTVELLFVGSASGLEATLVPQEGIPFYGLPVIGLPRRPGIRMIRALFAALQCILRARKRIESWGPDVVFATGGFASAPVLAAAWLAKIPVVLHEQNSVPGLTNRIASRFAREVHITFSASRQHFPRRGHLRLSGIPIREGIAAGSRGKALRLFRLDDARQTVLVFGGSQGAHRLNEAILDALPRLAARQDIQFVLQSGQADYNWMLDRCRRIQVRTWVRPFLTNMSDAYAAADLVVCRAGALTLGELAATGRPAILVPYPHATANHQMLNAEAFVEVGGAILIADADLTGELLAQQVADLLDNPRRLRTMSVQVMRMARADAAERIVRSIRRIAEGPSVHPPEPVLPSPRRRGRERNVARQGA